jgi:hypothetical protein
VGEHGEVGEDDEGESGEVRASMSAGLGRLALVAAVLALPCPASLAAQGGIPSSASWKVTVTAPASPVPIGACFAVELLVKTANGKDRARNAAGNYVQPSEFDFEVTSAEPKAAAGQYRDANHFAVCSCQGATVGGTGTVTARYPSASIDPKLLVNGNKPSRSASRRAATTRRSARS